MYTYARIDSHLNREGLHQNLVYSYESNTIYLSGCGDSYARACILMGITDVSIYAGNGMLSVKQAYQIKQEMLDTLSLDYAKKRGRKPTLNIKVISPIDGTEYEKELS